MLFSSYLSLLLTRMLSRLLPLLMSLLMVESLAGPTAPKYCLDQESIDEAIRQLDELGVLATAERKMIVASMKAGSSYAAHRVWTYRPLFFRATLEEFISIGLTNKKDLSHFLQKFSTLPVEAQKKFSQNIVARIDEMVQRLKNSESEWDHFLQELKVKKNELEDFISEWSQMRQSTNFDNSTAESILELLEHLPQDYLDNIVSAKKTKLLSIVTTKRLCRKLITKGF